MGDIPQTIDLVPVFRGPFSRALTLQSSLGAVGLRTHIRNENIKSIDPFITGGQIFDVALEADSRDEAEILAEIERLTAVVAGSQSEPGQRAPAPTRTEAERLAHLIRWLCVLFAPAALFLAPAYLRAARAQRPSGHGWNRFVLVVAAVLTLMFLLSLTPWFR